MSNQTPIRVTGTFTPGGTQDVNIVSPNPLPTEDINIEKSFGTWAYYSGLVGTVVVGAGQRVVGISAYSSTGGSLTINGGSTVTLPAGVAVSIEPNGNLTAPTIIFTGTSTYFVEVVS